MKIQKKLKSCYNKKPTKRWVLFFEQKYNYFTSTAGTSAFTESTDTAAESTRTESTATAV